MRLWNGDHTVSRAKYNVWIPGVTTIAFLASAYVKENIVNEIHDIGFIIQDNPRVDLKNRDK